MCMCGAKVISHTNKTQTRCSTAHVHWAHWEEADGTALNKLYKIRRMLIFIIFLLLLQYFPVALSIIKHKEMGRVRWSSHMQTVEPQADSQDIFISMTACVTNTHNRTKYTRKTRISHPSCPWRQLFMTQPLILLSWSYHAGFPDQHCSTEKVLRKLKSLGRCRGSFCASVAARRPSWYMCSKCKWWTLR